MNYLELCKALAREAGVSGSIASVTGQTGELLRLVNWIARAYNDILIAHSDWEFLRADVQFSTNVGSRIYSAAAAGVAEFGEWRFGSYDGWRAYLTEAGTADEQPVSFILYDDFRSTCLYSTQRDQVGRPQVVTEAPDQSLLFWPLPDMQYTIVGEQYRHPAALLDNADVPVFPARFHDAIVQRALMLYAQFEEAPAVFASAQSEYARLLEQLESRYLPSITTSGPMA
jgi:hypothetical protein